MNSMKTLPLASIIIPCAPYHTDLVEQAIASAEAQTVPCEVLTEEDTRRRGPAAIRNELARKAHGLFVVFLDADDTLEPTFVEQCAQVYKQGTYVYTAWVEHDGEHQPQTPCQPYRDGGYHLVTTLYPRQAFLKLDGFDEHLPGGEDTDFYLRSAARGLCPLFVNQPLVHYEPAGERGRLFAQHDDLSAIMEVIYTRNGGFKTTMGCNCTKAPQLDPNAGQMPGMIQAIANYAPMTMLGSATGHAYPRHLGRGMVMWVYPQDAAARPDLWTPVPQMTDSTPTVDEVLRLAGL